ncbi:MAG: DUF4159 domain-containing protein [Gammaproteobacteria bacterium]|nr:DUF4159 domain-containing protein [Gammaproteobacteria bacterium]
MRSLPIAALMLLTQALFGGAANAASETRYPEEANHGADLTEVNLARVEYDSIGRMGEAYYQFEGRVWARWETDYPQAEHNFAKRLRQLTRLNPAASPVRLRLTDPDLGDYPLIFMSDVGYANFKVEEADALRAYLKNGGFLWADDFWGDAEWASLERFMRVVLPGNRWREVPMDHPIFHTVFEMEEMPQIPARSFAGRGPYTSEPPSAHRYPAGSLIQATMRGYFDDDGRLMVIGTHNTDIADGWEREAYGQWYFERFSTKSYRLGVNVYTYVLTH